MICYAAHGLLATRRILKADTTAPDVPTCRNKTNKTFARPLVVNLLHQDPTLWIPTTLLPADRPQMFPTLQATEAECAPSLMTRPSLQARLPERRTCIISRCQSSHQVSVHGNINFSIQMFLAHPLAKTSRPANSSLNLFGMQMQPEFRKLSRSVSKLQPAGKKTEAGRRA